MTGPGQERMAGEANEAARETPRGTGQEPGRGAQEALGPGSDADPGDAQVGRVLAQLDVLADLPVAEHAAVFLDIHDRLSGQLNPEQQLRRAGADGSP